MRGAVASASAELRTELLWLQSSGTDVLLSFHKRMETLCRNRRHAAGMFGGVHLLLGLFLALVSSVALAYRTDRLGLSYRKRLNGAIRVAQLTQAGFIGKTPRQLNWPLRPEDSHEI